jgi:hypothetical protein
MRRLGLVLGALLFAVPARALVNDLLVPTSVNNPSSGTITSIAASTAGTGNSAGTRNCLTNLSLDSQASGGSVGPYPCQFVIYDGTLGSGTTIWSVIVTTNQPSAIETWPLPVPGVQIMDLCGTRGNTMLIRTSCVGGVDASFNGFTDK